MVEWAPCLEPEAVTIQHPATHTRSRATTKAWQRPCPCEETAWESEVSRKNNGGQRNASRYWGYYRPLSTLLVVWSYKMLPGRLVPLSDLGKQSIIWLVGLAAAAVYLNLSPGT